jgi:hypothetical protein
MSRPSLLARIQRLIESTYDWSTDIYSLDPYLVGDHGYAVHYAGRSIFGHTGADQPRTFVTYVGGPIRLGIYYPDSLIRRLEEANPLHGITHENVLPFAALVEELDHFLMLAWSARHQREVSLLELEFHANVTTYLVLAHFLGRTTGRIRLSTEQRKWIRKNLFDGVGESLPEPHRSRYRNASRLALAFLMSLERLNGEEKLRFLRRFARQSWPNQRTLIESGDCVRRSGLLRAFGA